MFTAGSHIDLHLANGLIRSYSLLNDYNERSQYVIGVKHDPQGRGGSSFVHQRLKVGEVMTISSPRNNFAFHESTDSSVFIAGGIGITPILSMVRRATALGRRWDLHYASRTRRHAAFLDQLETLERRSHGRLNAVFDHEDGGEPLNIASLVADVPPQSHIYCCGPLPLLEAFEAATQSRPRHMVHVEYFTAKEAAATAGGFEVRLARSGRSIPVCAGQTILDALLDAGVPISYSCSEGVCGTCETRVLEGIPDHRDVYLSDAEKAENKQIMICCSGSKTPTLLLDL
jgi:ferredoxin-NADP reductase